MVYNVCLLVNLILGALSSEFHSNAVNANANLCIFHLKVLHPSL